MDLLFASSRSEQVALGFFGGEPLLRYDLVEGAAAYARERAQLARKSVKFSVTTNATLLTPEVVASMKCLGIPALVSLDGMPHAENQRLYTDGTPSADKSLVNSLHALEAGIELTVRWTLTPGTVRYVPGDLRALARLGFRTVALEYVYEVEWTEAALKELEEALGDIARFYISELRAGRRLTVKPIDDGLNLFHMEQRQTSRCGLATHGVAVGADGSIYPCHRFVTRGGPVIGHVLTGWDEPALKAAQEWDVNRMRSESGSCRDCPVQLRCVGCCLCTNLDVCGDRYVSPRAFCELQRIGQRVANDVVGVLYAEKNPILLEKLKKPDLRT